jgi:opacity protein-like surface antigen
MSKLAAATVVAIAALTAPAMAADLIVEQAPVAYDPSPVTSGLYLQLLGGTTLDGTLEYYSPTHLEERELDIPGSLAVAGVIGFGTGIDGLSIEGDFFISQSDYSGDDSYVLTTTTAMAALKYTVELNDTFSVYGAVGVGGVHYYDEDQLNDVLYMDAWGAGYLLKAGVTAKIAENIALVGEVRYTNTFSRVEYSNGYTYELGTTSVLAGLHFGF